MEVITMTTATETMTFDAAAYDKYYKRACEVCAPIKLKVPVYVVPVVIEKKPDCLNKGY
jgi:hypothetical protein